LKQEKAIIMRISRRRVLDTLLLLETFAALPQGSHGFHLRQVAAETPENPYNRITQSSNANERAIVEGLPGPVVVTVLQASPRIIGGSNTDPGEYPFFVATASSVCGGTLIHPDIMLTAAHCQKGLAAARVVYVGAQEIDTLTTTTEKRTLIRQYPHPDVNVIGFQNDVMLFQLNEPVNNAPVVRLNSDSDLPRLDSALTVIGFGTTSVAYFTPSNTLLGVDVYPVDPDTCAQHYNATVTVDRKTMLCAGHAQPNRDSCSGDSGGPLLDKATGEQVGIVSFGRGCGDPDFPGVYTRVSKYASWIRDRICELSAVPPSDCPTKPDPSADSVRVILYIKYDSRPTESFWRLEDNATGQAVAFQPALPEGNASFSQVISLPPGKYTLHFTDTAGNGICCGYGKGKIVISMEGPPISAGVEAPEVMATKSRVDKRADKRVENVIADSNGKFRYQLSLPFVVAPDLEGYTISEDSGVGSSLMVIYVAVALSSIVVVTALTAVLRFCIKK
jgi:hypothetical protein